MISLLQLKMTGLSLVIRCLLVFGATISIQPFFIDEAFAGGASSGPGVVLSSAEESKSTGVGLIKLDQARLSRAFEYAITDKTVKGEMESIALQLAMAGVDTTLIDPALKITSELKRAFDRISNAKDSSLDFLTITSLVKASLETALIPVKQTVPGFSPLLSTLKLTTAFVTAFSYAYFVWDF